MGLEEVREEPDVYLGERHTRQREEPSAKSCHRCGWHVLETARKPVKLKQTWRAWAAGEGWGRLLGDKIRRWPCAMLSRFSRVRLCVNP